MEPNLNRPSARSSRVCALSRSAFESVRVRALSIGVSVACATAPSLIAQQSAAPTPNSTTNFGVAEGMLPARSSQVEKLDAGTWVTRHSGEVIHGVTDASVQGRAMDVALTRVYRSQIAYDGAFGPGWTHSYDQRLWLGAQGALTHLDGTRFELDSYPAAGGALRDCATPGVYRKARLIAPNTWEIRDPRGVIRRFLPIDGSVTSGKLDRITDTFGNFVSAVYNAQGQLSSLHCDSFDATTAPTRRIDFTYQSGRIASVIDVHGGRTWTYAHASDGTLSSVSTPAVPTLTGTTTTTAPRVTHYTYVSKPKYGEDKFNLLTVRYPGHALPRLEFVYDSDDHVTKANVRSSASNVHFYKFTYAAGASPAVLATQVTDRRGHTTQYQFNATGQALSLLDPLNHLTSYEYNGDGEVTRHIHPNGAEIRTTFDSASVADRFQHGNVDTQLFIPAGGSPGTQASYRIQRQFEPVYNHELDTIDEAGASVFDYQEDPQTVAALVSDWGILGSLGGPLGDVNGDGRTDLCGGSRIEHVSPPITLGLPVGVLGPVVRTETWTYDDFGRTVSHADAEGALTTYEYTGDYLTRTTVDRDPDPGQCPNSVNSFPNAGIARWSKDCSIEHVAAQTDFEYDSRGNTVAITDPRGVRATYEYNALDELQASTLAEGYDDSRLDPDLAALVEAGYEHLVTLAVQETIEYDGAGEAARIRSDNRGAGDPANPWIVSRMTYDMCGRLTLTENLLSGSTWSSTSVVYDASGNRVRVVDPEGAVEAFVYDAMDRLTELRRAAAPDGSVTAQTAVTKLEYDANGRRTAIEGPEDFNGDGQNERELYEYDGRNRVHRVIDAVGSATTHLYDSRGRRYRTEIHGALGGPSPSQNSTAGNVLLSVSEQEFDEVGEPIVDRSLRFTLGQLPTTAGPQVHWRRDRAGRVVSETDSAGQVVSTVFDGMGRPIAVSDDVGNLTTARLDKAGYVLEVNEFAVDPAGGAPIQRMQRDTYDGLGRLIRSVSGGEVVYFAYDARGDVVVRADGRSSIVQPDPLGLYTAASLPNPGNTTRTTYERTTQGLRIRSHSDMWPGGTASGTYAIWAADLDPTLAPAGVAQTQTSTVQHDRVGNVVQVISAGNRTMTFDYDDQRRMTLKQFPDGSSTTTTYWKDGSIRTHTLRDSANSVFRAFETHYDAAGRTQTVQLIQTPPNYAGTQSQTFEWNGLGLLTRATDVKVDPAFAPSLVERTYDSLSRVLTETQDGLAVSVDYDDLYETRFHFPSGRTIDRQFDTLGRIDQISETSTTTNIADYSYYGPNSRVSEIAFGNGTKKSYRTPQPGSGQPTGYSASGRPLQIEHKAPNGAAASVFGSAYDAAGNRWLRLRQIGGGLTGDVNGFDSRNRVELFQEQIDATTQIAKGYVRDADGDWTLLGVQQQPNAPSIYSFVTMLASWAYTSLAGKSLDHDAAGNRTRDFWFDYQYDAFDRLVLVKDRYSSTIVARYSYDAFSRRIEKHDWMNDTLRYLYDGDRAVETRDSSGAIVDQFVHGDGIDELVQWIDAQGQTRYFLTDEVGSVIGLTDASGNVIERVSYDSFGAPTFRDAAGALITDYAGAPVAVSPIGNRFLYQGREYDGELALWRRAQPTPGYFAEVPAAGQYNFRYRYVSPEEGRFTSRDPYAMANNDAIDPSFLVGRILTGESESPYEMHRGNPIDRADPWGLSMVTMRWDVMDPVATPVMYYRRDADGEAAMWAYNEVERRVGGTAIFGHKPCGFQDQGGGGRGRGQSGRGNGRPSSGGGAGGGGPSAGGGKGGGGPTGGKGGGAGGGAPGQGKPGGGKPGGGKPGPNGLLPDAKGNGQPGGGAGGGGGGGGGAKNLKLVDKLTSFLEANNSENPPLFYLKYCINFGPAICEAVIEDAEQRIKNDPGLPQPGAPTTGPKSPPNSLKLYERWKKERDAYRASPRRSTGGGDLDLMKKMNNTMREGIAMSCTYFSSEHHINGKGGPVPYLDCREAWKTNSVQDPSATGGAQNKAQGENNGVAEPGSGHEVSALETRRRDDGDVAGSARAQALERFHQRLVRDYKRDRLLPIRTLGLAITNLRLRR